MKRILLSGCILLSMTITMCDSPSPTNSGLTKKQKLAIYTEKVSAEIKADSVADAFNPLKKELENKLDANRPNIGDLRKKYQAEYVKWSSKKLEYMDVFTNEIVRKYNIPDDVYFQVCKDMSQEVSDVYNKSN